MHRQLTPIDKFARCVENIKKSIVYNIKAINKYMKEIKKANGQADKQALLKKISDCREALERYRLELDDLTCAFVRENQYASEKIVKRYKYKTVEGFLMDRDSKEKPSLAQMIEIISQHTFSLPFIYKFEYDEIGRRTVKRDLSMVKASDFHMVARIEDRKAIGEAVSSGARHK